MFSSCLGRTFSIEITSDANVSQLFMFSLKKKRVKFMKLVDCYPTIKLGDHADMQNPPKQPNDS